MTCRLCLCEMEVFVSIFDESDCNADSLISKLIAKYLHIELQIEDMFSNKICDSCWYQLNNFHQFWVLIEEKQQKLQNFFKDGLVYEPEHKKKSRGIEMEMSHIENHLTEGSASTVGQMQDVLTKVYVPGQEKNLPIFEKLIDAILDERTFHICRDVGMTVTEDVVVSKVGVISEDEKLGRNAVVSDEETFKESEAVTDHIFNTDIATAHKTEEVAPSTTTVLRSLRIRKMKSQNIVTISSTERDDFIAKHLQLKCDICEDLFENFANLRVHFKKFHNIRPYVISCCGNRIYSANELYEHVQWHLDPEYFKCDDCGQMLQNRKSLNKHKRTNKRHKTKDEDYKCELCEKTFAHSYLEKHMMIYHSKEKFICKYCNKSFKIRERLIKHIGAMHENVISHICDVCGKIFRHKPVFDSHMLEHRGMIPSVQCEVCGEWKKNKRILNLHMAIHNKITVKCKYCERECSSKLSLGRHIRYMHRLKLIWQCKICEKSFKTERILKEHEATHTGAKLYNCQHCDHNSRSRSNMYVHVKKQHPKEWVTEQLSRSKNKPSNAEIIKNL